MASGKQKKAKIVQIEREIESIQSNFRDTLESPASQFLPTQTHQISQQDETSSFEDYYGIPLAIEEIRALKQLSLTLDCPLPPLSNEEYPDNLESMVKHQDDFVDQQRPYKRGVIIEKGHVVKMITRSTIVDSDLFNLIDPAIGKLRFLTEINCIGLGQKNGSYYALPEDERYAVWEIVHNLYFPPEDLSWSFDIENGHVVEIKINDIYLHIVPESINNFTMLRKLSLHGTLCFSLPDSIGSLQNLHEIWITRHELNTLPESIGQLDNLKVLTIADRNKISPANRFFASSFSIPPTLSNLSQLECLNLSGNQISSMPEILGQLIDLKKLYLSSNLFYEFPNNLTQLGNLVHLDLSYNPIMTIPSWIDRLSSLQDLIISNTNITQLPHTLCNLSKLHTLDLSGCLDFAKHLSENAEILLSLKFLLKLSIPTPPNSNLYPKFLLDMPTTTKILGYPSNFDLPEIFPSILQKIREGRPMGWIEQHHPHLAMWVSRIEDECIETIKNPTSVPMVKNNAVAILQFLKTQNFLLRSTRNGNSLLL